jgi:transcription termination factor Rho
MNRFRSRVTILVIASTAAGLMLACAARGEPSGGATANECMAAQTKAACDESEAACSRFLSEEGQKRARKACSANLSPPASQPAFSAEVREPAQQPDEKNSSPVVSVAQPAQDSASASVSTAGGSPPSTAPVEAPGQPKKKSLPAAASAGQSQPNSAGATHQPAAAPAKNAAEPGIKKPAAAASAAQPAQNSAASGAGSARAHNQGQVENRQLLPSDSSKKVRHEKKDQPALQFFGGCVLGSGHCAD